MQFKQLLLQESIPLTHCLQFNYQTDQRRKAMDTEEQRQTRKEQDLERQDAEQRGARSNEDACQGDQGISEW